MREKQVRLNVVRGGRYGQLRESVPSDDFDLDREMVDAFVSMHTPEGTVPSQAISDEPKGGCEMTASTAIERDTREPPKYVEPAPTVVGRFFQDNTINELLCAARAVENLGFVPEIRLNDCAIELYVDDVPSMIRNLRASIEASGKGKRP